MTYFHVAALRDWNGTIFLWPSPARLGGQLGNQEGSWTSSRGCFSPREEFHLALVPLAPVPVRSEGQTQIPGGILDLF